MLRRRSFLSLEPFRNGQKLIYSLKRNYETSRHFLQQAGTQETSAWKNAKPMSEIPSPPRQPLIGHLSLQAKNAQSLHKFHDQLRKEYGNIVLLSLPGLDMVCIYGPEEGQLVYANDGKTPILPGFEPIEFYRYIHANFLKYQNLTRFLIDAYFHN